MTMKTTTRVEKGKERKGMNEEKQAKAKDIFLSFSHKNVMHVYTLRHIFIYFPMCRRRRRLVHRRDREKDGKT